MDKEAKYFQDRYGLCNLNATMTDCDDVWFNDCFGFEDIALSRDYKTVSLFVGSEKPIWIECTEYKDYVEGRDVPIENYFRNWRCPTSEEKCMFEMLYGVELFWSEDNPFVWPSEEDLK